MLKLALEHAQRHGLKRIVLAVPFLTIIEQTARVYRDVFADFPEHFVLEHHSLAGLGAETALGDAQPPQERERRLLAENRTPSSSSPPMSNCWSRCSPTVRPVAVSSTT